MEGNKILTSGKMTCLTWSIIVLVVAITIAIFVSKLKRDHVETVVNDEISPTPTLIKSMQDIGEWEFLSITDEELVDTIKRGLFSDDELVRIYYGTLRLGVNMHKASPGWLTVSGDTLNARLPRIELLDNNFIDEGRTLSFYENGSWTDADRAALYKRAYSMMRKRCLTPDNIKSAELSCSEQFMKIFKALGYENVVITYEK
ncbi:MAG: DUF4230 domain-containing protein [Prevotella sp.]|uniref:DUF4230 domain-containing protein n=1 Tax=Prevotella sp. TaxID=59823 RepID=UPI002A2A9908|nr:DUF4230 domain-containing protein [Prevotella sp.]MDD7319169.1 DUF4230 domain-containing protein [Prevotellaceae bacterium]MDY4020037.1 DUF4230 domain-containing protein [Prevotella sp.]